MNDTPTSPVLVQPKPFWESKTVWLNGLLIAAALLMFLIDSQTTGQLPFELDGKWVAFLLGLANFSLRFVTTAPVTSGSK